jgi:hypothetical protein
MNWLKKNKDLIEQLHKSEGGYNILASELYRIRELQKKQEEYVYVYGKVNYALYEPSLNSYSRRTIVKEGIAGTKVFKIRRTNIATFRQNFFSSTEVQYSSGESERSLYTTYPETVKIEVFKSMEEASNSLMKDCSRVLSMFIYNDVLGF